MSAKVLVAYVKHTGHLLAALTRVTDASGTANMNQVVTPDLRLRLLDPTITVGAPVGLEFSIPEGQLGTIVVDREDDLLRTPRTFKLADPKNQSSTLEKLPVKATAPNFPSTGQLTDTPVLSQNQLDVRMLFPRGIDPPDKPTPVWALIQQVAADEFQVVRGEIAANEAFVTIPLNAPIAPGPYKVLMFAGRSPVFATQLRVT